MESSAEQSTNQPTLHTNYPSILEQLCRQMAPPQPLLERSDADGNISSDLSTKTPASTSTSTSSVSLQKILNAYHNNGRICSMETNDEKTKHDQLLPFRESGVTNLLVAKLLLKDDTQQKTDFVAYLTLTRTLVIILPAWYLSSLSQSVSDLVSLAPQRISWQKLAYRGIDGNDNPTVLQLWVSLLANGSAPLKVHDQLSSALIAALLVDRAMESELLSTLRHYATAALVDDWRIHLADASVAATSSSGKVASVRCATVWMRMVSSWRLPRDSIADGLGLLLPMLRDGSDPLQQMSLLDAMIQDLDPNGGDDDTDVVSNDISAAECWSVPELVEVAVSFLRDPLLSDAALRYLGGLSSSHLSPDAQRLIVEHVHGVCDARGGRPPTRDSERLPVVRALYHMVSTSTPLSSSAAAAAHILDTILGDPILRSAWWDLSQTSNPKLRAAVLVSVARCLPRVAAAQRGDASRALRLYRFLGPDNTRGSATGTTRWLLDTAAISPIPEPRIASHALLAAMLRLPNHHAEVTNELVADPSATLSLVQDVLLAPTHETTTPDAQRARFDVLEAFLDNHCGGNNTNDNQSPSPVLAAACGITPSILRKLRSQRALGPYGKQVVRYGVDDDVA